MNDTTHKAPERIWLTRDETYWQNGLGIVFTFQNGSHDVEYVPADRIEEMEAELKYWVQDSADAWDKCEENRLKLAKAVKLMELSVELATWNTTLREDVIDFITELKGQDDE